MGGLGKSKSAPYVPPAPTPTPAPVMPEPDTTSILQAKKKAEELAMQRAGRASTILSGKSNSDTTGDSYGSTKLGAG